MIFHVGRHRDFLINMTLLNNINITLVSVDDSDQIEKFLYGINSSLVYYSVNYLKFLSFSLKNSELYYLVAENNLGIVGVLPFSLTRDDKIGSVINSLPFFGSHGGPCVDQSISDWELVEQSLCKALIDQATALNVKSITLVENPLQALASGLNSYGLSVIDERISQITDLPRHCDNIEEILFSKFHVKTRNAIRKGGKWNMNIAEETELDSLQWLQSIHESSIKVLSGVPKSRAVFEALVEAMPLGETSRLYIGRISGEPVCGLLVLLYGNTVEYFTPVVEQDFRSKQVLSNLIFKVMIELIESGYQHWNWGGTWKSQDGVYRFKSRWGAKDRRYRYFNKVYDSSILNHSPEKLRDAFPYYYLFKY